MNTSAKDTVAAATQADEADLVAGAPDTVDGVALGAGDRVLVKAQTDPIENGIYVVDTLGTGSDGVWSRAEDMDSEADLIGGQIVAVDGNGATNDSRVWYMLETPDSNSNLAVDTDAQTWVKFTDADSGVGAGGHVFNEVPAGAVDSSNVTFTLASTPIAGKQLVMLNGVVQHPGGGNDYTISGDEITMLDAPKGAPGNPDRVTVMYLK